MYATCLFCKSALGHNEALEHFPVGRRLSGVGVLVTAAPFLAELGLAAALLGAGTVLVNNFIGGRKMWRNARVPTIFLTDNDGRLLPLTHDDTWSATLVPVQGTREWFLTVRHREQEELTKARSILGFGQSRKQAARPAVLRGAAAQRALAAILPYASPTGGSAPTIRKAVGVIEASSSLDQLIYQATAPTRSSDDPDERPVTRLPARVRLALEMVLHEEDERRAMEGELAALEQRWREAEEIANIADALLVPAETEARLDALRRTSE